MKKHDILKAENGEFSGSIILQIILRSIKDERITLLPLLGEGSLLGPYVLSINLLFSPFLAS